MGCVIILTVRMLLIFLNIRGRCEHICVLLIKKIAVVYVTNQWELCVVIGDQF